ncbi:MAG: VOC family protein [Ferruginibacter sp.]
MQKKFLVTLLVFSCVFIAQKASAQEDSKKVSPVLNHIAVYVVDLNRSTKFYQNIVQLDTIPEPFHDGRHTWFAIGPVSHLHIIQGAKAISDHDKNTHLCFTVPSVPDFIKTLELNKISYENWAGAKMQMTKRVDGVFQIYFQDPDGYWVEINDAKD